MPRKQIPLLLGNYNKHNLASASTQRLVNMYLEEFPTSGAPRVGIVAIGTPGLIEWGDLSGGQVRALLQHKNYVYAVCDNKVYKIDPTTKVAVQIGTLLSSAPTRVVVAAIDDEIVFVEYTYLAADGTNSAVWSYKVATNNWAQVSQLQFRDYITSVVAYQGYFLYLPQNSKTIQVANLNDGRTIGGLSFFSANSFSENIIAMATSENYVYMLSEVGLEVWYLSGGAIVPFDRVSGGTLQYGILSPYSYCIINDALYFMCRDSTGFLGPMMAQGPNVQPIKTRDLTAKINSYNHNYDKTNGQLSAYSWVYNSNGHVMFCTTFPLSEDTRGHTWQFDTSTGIWSELEHYNIDGRLFPTQDQHIANCQCYANNLQLIGDYYSGKIYELSASAFDDAGTTISRVIQTRHFIFNDTFFSVNNIEIDIERSQALDGGVTPGSEPQIMIQFSKDRGHTWSQEIWRTASEIGQFKRRVRISSLGGARVFTLRLTMTDPINWVVANCTMEVSGSEINTGTVSG